MRKSYSFIYRNALTLTFLLFMIVSLAGQIISGWKEHNEDLQRYGLSLTWWQYLGSGHFLQATFENWESEFLQMALFVVLTIFLRQQGSSESKDCGEDSFDPGDLEPQPDSPRPVKKGGFILAIYKHSLSIALIVLFLASFALHAYGSWIDFNEQQSLMHEPTKNLTEFLKSSKLWFESFQNWQSEFLSVFAIIFLSIYLRQYGSPQSKAVNAAHKKTGGD